MRQIYNAINPRAQMKSATRCADAQFLVTSICGHVVMSKHLDADGSRRVYPEINSNGENNGTATVSGNHILTDESKLTRNISDIENQNDLTVDIEHIPRKYIWRSCCLILDSRAVLFFSQLAISIIVVIFCIRQMIVLEDPDAQKNYGILLSFMVGLWFPAPKIGT